MAGSASNPTLSIIIPTFNRRDRLKRLLASLEQPFRAGTRLEVVVSVDGATDGTEEMLSALRPAYPLRVISQPNSGPAAARNRGVAAASGAVLLFLDDDIMVADRLVEHHLAVHQADPEAVVIGPILPPTERRLTPWAWWEAQRLQRHYDALRTGDKRPTPHHFYTANGSVRRQHALAVGGFAEDLKRGEDIEFAYRLEDRGLRFHFVPEAAVLHETDHQFREWLRVPYMYGCVDVAMAREAGHTHALELALAGWPTRHPLTRAVAHRCVGHPARLRGLLGLGTRLVTYTGPGAPYRLQVTLCGLLFNVQHWQGIADATGLGAGVWRGLRDQLRAFSSRPRTKLQPPVAALT